MKAHHHFPASVRADNAPESEALVDFMRRHGFIYATKRTRVILLALVADKVLKVSGKRYTMKGMK